DLRQAGAEPDHPEGQGRPDDEQEDHRLRDPRARRRDTRFMQIDRVVERLDEGRDEVALVGRLRYALRDGPELVEDRLRLLDVALEIVGRAGADPERHVLAEQL